MSDFIIITDSSADLDAQLAATLDVHILPLRFTIDDQTFFNYPDNRDMSLETFYQKLRQGALATTSAVNVDQYTSLMAPLLASGKDILILSFSSALSATYNSGVMALEELREQFPQREIYAVDTLCVSLGLGLLVSLAAQRRAAGESITQVRDWVEAHKLSICHHFTVDDLHFLKRGGRISSTTAAVGSMLHIKPVLHVNDQGLLLTTAKARGRGAAIRALLTKMEETAIDPASQQVFISHGDCLPDAMVLAQQVRERFGVQEIYLNHIGPVLGAHAGPGTLTLFYVGTHR